MNIRRISDPSTDVADNENGADEDKHVESAIGGVEAETISATDPSAADADKKAENSSDQSTMGVSSIFTMTRC